MASTSRHVDVRVGPRGEFPASYLLYIWFYYLIKMIKETASKTCFKHPACLQLCLLHPMLPLLIISHFHTEINKTGSGDHHAVKEYVCCMIQGDTLERTFRNILQSLVYHQSIIFTFT